MKSLFTLVMFTLALSLHSFYAMAGDEEIALVIQNHQFLPSELQIPAGKKVRLIIDNRDSTPEEFESFELNREKVIGGGGKASLFIGPLKPGRYPFFGEFNQKTAQGVIIVK
ncbi:MAG: cupredoxin domain-containing protein [Methylophilaceae bacterium]|nr:cupredoxin domain-containing protein [Methylophilaceae bacterium]